MDTATLVQYLIICNLTILFTVLALVTKKDKVAMKLISGVCWIIFAIIQVVLVGTEIMSLMCMFLFSIFGLIFFIWMIKDLMDAKQFYKMGQFE